MLWHLNHSIFRGESTQHCTLFAFQSPFPCLQYTLSQVCFAMKRTQSKLMDHTVWQEGGVCSQGPPTTAPFCFQQPSAAPL